MTLYDREKQFTTLSFTVLDEKIERNIYFDRPKLAEVTGRVVNGEFTGMMIAPQSPLALNEGVLLRVYAHKDGTDYMVNGLTKQVKMLPYDEATAISDTQAPVITAMFVNDESTFTDGAMIAPNAMLYITASDDEAINMQSNSVQSSMKLQLDGGKTSYNDVTCYATVGDDGKTVNVEFPLSSLSEGCIR